jgi:nuclear transport factor 2 (NTF2) superfamily protein
MATRPPVPPFTVETAIQKVPMAEDAWNSRDPDRVVQVYTEDTQWRNRADREQVRGWKSLYIAPTAFRPGPRAVHNRTASSWQRSPWPS